MFFLILMLTVVSIHTATAQNDTASSAWTTRKKVVAGGLVVQQISSFVIQYYWWWEGDYHPFFVENDGYFRNYFLGVDKLGHGFTSYMYAHGIRELCTYGGFSEKSTRRLSWILPAFWAISIEIGDGFSSYGYSHQDLVANLSGLGFAILQQRVPYFKNFKMKMSYTPSKHFRESNFNGWTLTNDYWGHMYWMTFDVHQMLPQHVRRFWPPFLNLGIGYGLDNRPEVYPGIRREIAISLDWNISAIHARKGSGTYLLKEMFDYFHYPAPGISKTLEKQEHWKPIFFR